MVVNVRRLPWSWVRTGPPAPGAASPGVEQRNASYTYTGSRQNVPLRVFDDGRSTYFRWAEGAATPAVFIKAADGGETLADVLLPPRLVDLLADPIGEREVPGTELGLENSMPFVVEPYFQAMGLPYSHNAIVRTICRQVYRTFMPSSVRTCRLTSR